MRILIFIIFLFAFPSLLSAQDEEHCANHIILTLVSVNLEEGCDFADSGTGIDPTISIYDLNGFELIGNEVENINQNFPADNVPFDLSTNTDCCGGGYTQTLGIYPIDQVDFQFEVEVYDNDGGCCNGYQPGSDDNYGTGIISINIITEVTGTIDVGSCISFNYVLDITPIYMYGRNEFTETVCPDFSITFNDIDYDIDNPMGFDTIWGGSANGCDSFIQVELDFYEFEEPEIIGDFFICLEGAGQLTVDGDYDSYAWSNGSTSQVIEITEPGIYEVVVTNDDNCDLTDIVVVDYYDTLFPDIFGDNQLCVGGQTVLEVADDFSQYQWSNGSTNPETVVSDEGWYMVTVVSTEGCILENAFFVEYLEVIEPEIVGDAVICYDGSTELAVGGMYSGYAWSTGDALSNIVINGGGQYTVTVSNSIGCTDEASIEVFEQELYTEQDTFYTCNPEEVGVESLELISPEGCPGAQINTTILYAPVPNYVLVPNTTIISGTNAPLYINIASGIEVNWYGPDGALICGSCDSLNVQPNVTSEYMVEINYHPECQIREFVNIKVKSDTRVYIPNIFTPDSDDENNRFTAYGPDILSIDVLNIYDRWGSLIFEGGGQEDSWDGTMGGLDLLSGMYAYYIEITFNDGTTMNYAGDITLLQ